MGKPNGLYRYLKGHQVISLDLSAKVKLEVIWITDLGILPRSRPNLGFSYDILVFY